MLKRALAASALVLLAVSCDDPTYPVVNGIQSDFTAAGLVVTNYRPETIYYFAAEQAILARIDWAPCFGGLPCPHLDPGKSATISYEQLMWGVDGSQAAVLYWWRMVPDEDGSLRPDSLRSRVVRK